MQGLQILDNKYYQLKHRFGNDIKNIKYGIIQAVSSNLLAGSTAVQIISRVFSFNVHHNNVIYRLRRASGFAKHLLTQKKQYFV